MFFTVLTGATTSSVTQLKEEVSGWHAKLQTEVARSSTQCTEWVDEVRGCLRETETRLQSQVDQLLEKVLSHLSTASWTHKIPALDQSSSCIELPQNLSQVARRLATRHLRQTWRQDFAVVIANCKILLHEGVHKVCSHLFILGVGLCCPSLTTVSTWRVKRKVAVLATVNIDVD